MADGIWWTVDLEADVTGTYVRYCNIAVGAGQFMSLRVYLIWWYDGALYTLHGMVMVYVATMSYFEYFFLADLDFPSYTDFFLGYTFSPIDFPLVHWP